MGFLAGLVADLGEWLIEKLGSMFTSMILWWNAEDKSKDALQTNQDNLNKAESSGNPSAIQQAGDDSLNNTGGN